MKRLFLSALACLTILSCNNTGPGFEIYGHRGWRGMYPENTMVGFAEAAKAGITHFELDVVISADGLVVVSNKPWLSSVICSDPNGNPLYESTEQAYNLYRMRYSEIMRCECGLKKHPDFPEQKKISAKKPLLSTVLDSLEKLKPAGTEFYYSIDIKSMSGGDNVFHPVPQTFVETVLGVIMLNGVEKRTTIQSFDNRVLIYMHEYFPDIKLSLLVDEDESLEEKWVDLGFTPDVISPHYSLLFEDMVKQIHKAGARVIPWTVNDIYEAERLRQLKVDGFITDHPDQYYPPSSSVQSVQVRP
jgi:glycerophosphoryl diester phosphodiesterase